MAGGAGRGRGRAAAGGLVAAVLGAAAAGAAGGGGGGLPDLGPGPALDIQTLIEFERTGVVVLPGLVPEVGEYAPALRYAWAQSAKKYAVMMDEKLNCDLGIEDSLEGPPDTDAGDAWESADVDASVEEALRLLEEIDSCTLGLLGITAPIFANIGRYNSGIQKFSESGRVADVASQLLNSPVRLLQANFHRSGTPPEQEPIGILARGTDLRRDVTRTPMTSQRRVTAWCPITRVDQSTHALPIHIPRSYNSHSFFRGHEQVWSTLENSMALVPESEDSDEPMNWKAAPDHFLSYIWTENEENPEKNFMSDMARYSRRPVSDKIQAAIEMFCRGIDQDEPYDITERNLCVLSEANIRPMQLARERLGPENDAKVTLIYEVHKRYAEAVWTWAGGVKIHNHYDVGDCIFYHTSSLYAKSPAGLEVTEAIELTFVEDDPLNFVFTPRAWKQLNHQTAALRSIGEGEETDFKLLTSHYYPAGPDGGLEWLGQLFRWPPGE